MHLFVMHLLTLLTLLSLCNAENSPMVLMAVSSPNVPPVNLCGAFLTGKIPPLKLPIVRATANGISHNVTAPYALFSRDGKVNTSVQPPPRLLVVTREPESIVNSEYIVQVDGEYLGNLLAKLDANKPGSAMISVLNESVPNAPSKPPFVVFFAEYAVNLYAIAAILLGCLLVVIKRQEILEAINTRNIVMKKMWMPYLWVMVLVAVLVGAIVLCYFLYDVAVYIYIVWFCLLSTFAIATVLFILISLALPALGKTFPVKVSLGRHRLEYSVSPLRGFLLLIGVAYMIIWVVYRNNPQIGFPMQSVAGTVAISWILLYLPLSSMSPTLKMFTILYAAVVLYDVFFVFISPYFASKASPESEEVRLNREARSSLGSIMEDVATGKAGRSGELLPLAFRAHYEWAGSAGVYCPTNQFSSLLGFGDAMIPGLLCTYVALYDWLWKVRYRHNFVGTFTGFLLGLVVTNLVLHVFRTGQPALLYLCPCTLMATVLCALCFGGREELARLWAGSLPPLSPLASNNVDGSTTSRATAVPPLGDGVGDEGSRDLSELQLILPTVAVLPEKTTGDDGLEAELKLKLGPT